MLTGKTIVVAGATGGIGEGVTRQFLRHGANVVALGRSEEKLDQLREYLAGVQTGNLITVKANLDQPEKESRELQDRLNQRFGDIDGAVVAIGNWGNANRRLIDVSDEQWEQAIRDNLVSHFRALRTLIPLIKRDGALVHFSGLSADGPYPGAGLIGLTNAAKKSLVLTMAAEQEATGPRIHELIIGPIRTRERVAAGIARAEWYDPEELGDFASELIRGETEAARQPLHYRVQRSGS
ncbi:SDR family oxidoreductase [uncultured Paenibacillus sp.]|uniref:SDR family NAD(P)-dependent oxidoreductase n=1 Tax=uncultured Paenibacillus sp. TaxID=227322 RepID=UPI0015AFBFD1|nr:SDR family oxidoreductase [uncultured Paenibacillus sp.]